MMVEGTSPAVVITKSYEAPSRTDGSETFSVTTWNICCGRNGGLESALRAMDSMGIGVAFLMETKLAKGIYIRCTSRYQVLASDAVSARQGGVALCWKEGIDYVIEEQRVWGANVVTCHLITGKTQYYVVGAYIPPADTGTLENGASRS